MNDYGLFGWFRDKWSWGKPKGHKQWHNKGAWMKRGKRK